jgi:hypothetical protein
VAVGDFGKPAPEVGREQALWQGGSVVDRFEARKRSEGGSPKLSTATPVADGETEAEAWTGGRGGRRLGWGAARRCTRARGWVGWDGKRAKGVGTGEVLDGRPGGGKELGGVEVMEAKRRKIKSGEHPIYPRKAVEGGGGIGGREMAVAKPWARARRRRQRSYRWGKQMGSALPPPPSSMLVVAKGGRNRRTWVQKPLRGRKQRRCMAVGKQRPLAAAAVRTVRGLKPTPVGGVL